MQISSHISISDGLKFVFKNINSELSNEGSRKGPETPEF